MADVEDEIGNVQNGPNLPTLQVTPLSEPIEDDDDFGSFDEVSFENFQEPKQETDDLARINSVFNSAVFKDNDLLLKKLDELMESIFPGHPQDNTGEPTILLQPEASRRLEKLSEPPRLNPPNWIKLKIRHNLLIKLGVPINLDELEAPKTTGSSSYHGRKKPINEQDIDWSQFIIPEFESLDISPEKAQELQTNTNTILSRIEEDNLSNTSQLFLEKSLDTALDSKLAQMKENYRQLLELSAVWQHSLKELQNNQEIYESVVQDMIGYSQKLQRNELIEHLQKSGKKKGRRTF